MFYSYWLNLYNSNLNSKFPTPPHPTPKKPPSIISKNLIDKNHSDLLNSPGMTHQWFLWPHFHQCWPSLTFRATFFVYSSSCQETQPSQIRQCHLCPQSYIARTDDGGLRRVYWQSPCLVVCQWEHVFCLCSEVAAKQIYIIVHVHVYHTSNIKHLLLQVHNVSIQGPT